MAQATKPRRTQVEAIDALAAEVRTSNLIAVLALGTSALDHVDVSKLKQPATVARQERLNVARAGIREGLGL